MELEKLTERQKDEVYEALGMTRKQFEREKPWEQYHMTREDYELHVYDKSHEDYGPPNKFEEQCKTCCYRYISGYDKDTGEEEGWYFPDCQIFDKKPRDLYWQGIKCKYYKK